MTSCTMVKTLGASTAWSAVFSGTRGSLILLCWSAATFISASVGASSIQIITSSNQINLDRDMGARRVLRLFAVLSATLTLTGIMLLNVGVMQLGLVAGADTQIIGLNTNRS